MHVNKPFIASAERLNAISKGDSVKVLAVWLGTWGGTLGSVDEWWLPVLGFPRRSRAAPSRSAPTGENGMTMGRSPICLSPLFRLVEGVEGET